MLIVYSCDGDYHFTGSLPHLASDGLDLTVYSIHRVIMVCSLLQELFIFSCVPSGTGCLCTSPACIGVGTGGARAPPQYFTLETLLIFMHAAQITAIPQNGIASYAYDVLSTTIKHRF